MDETRERFLRAITDRVPAGRIVEAHMFPPIRQGGVEAGLAVVAATPAEEDAPSARHTVYTARYRLTLKGAERGKWETDVVAEADAPLVAVDEVVRGVQRRAGEVAEPERLSADAFRWLVEPAPG